MSTNDEEEPEESLNFRALETNRTVSFLAPSSSETGRRVPRRPVKRQGILANSADPSATVLTYGEDGDIQPTALPLNMNDPATELMNRSGSTRESSSGSTGDLSVRTDLHEALADSDSSVEQLRKCLENDPSAASFPDMEGKLPLHIVAENEELHTRLGAELDTFILKELIQKNRRALVTRSTSGEFPFVQAIQDWVENINEVAEATKDSPQQLDPSPKGSNINRALGLVKEASGKSFGAFFSMDFNSEHDSDEDQSDGKNDLAERLMPWNVFIDDLAHWSIEMLSQLIEREPLKAMWVLKLVDVVAAIPNFLKTVLLIDDDESRKSILESRLLKEVMLHEASIGKWLVYMITSDDDLAQDRAVLYLQSMTVLEALVTSESRTSSRTSIAFSASNHNFLERQNKVYVKAASLPEIIPAFMHFNPENFTKCSTTSIVQFILDQKLFQPTTVAVILLDIFFLTLAVVLYTLCSNKVFKHVSDIKYSQQVSYVYNQTSYDLCADGTLTNDDACQYYNQQNTSYNLGSVKIFGGSYDCDISCQVCQDHFNFDGASMVLSEGSEVGERITCYDVAETHSIDTFLIFCLMALSVNCFYFLSRSLSAWVTVPRKYLLSQFGLVFTAIDTLSIIFPLVMLAIFLTFVYHLDMLEKDSFLPLGIYNTWMDEADILSACSAAAAGLLYLKIIMYFKVLNQYTATFIFALGEVIKDIFWFFWIMVVIIFAFSQMFYTTLSCNEGYCRSDTQGSAPFNHFTSSLLYTYSILLGEFDLEQFDTPFTTMLFVLYTFAIVIVVLNFLIAIVGDSFDKSMTKIETHFGRARLMFMVELSAFQSYAEVPFHEGTNKKNYRRLLLCGSWKGCFSYLVVASALFTGFTFLIIEKEIVGRGGVGVLVTMGALLAVLVLSPFLWKFRIFAFLSDSKLLQPVRSTLGRLLITFFRLILGKSILAERSEKEKKDWGGRLKHIISAMTEKISQSEAITSKTISSSEASTAKAIEKVQQRVVALEENVSDIKNMLVNIQLLLEKKEE